MHLSYRPTDSLWGHGMEKRGTIQFLSPWGLMSIATTELGIYEVAFLDEPLSYALYVGKNISPENRKICNSIDNHSLPGIDLAQNLQNAMDFINGRGSSDNIWMCPICSDFQFTVYRELLKIPCGKTATYSEVATAIGRPTATRAVATAIAKNPIAVLVPCHRVVPAAGDVGKYAWGTERKRMLLCYESLK